MYCKPSQPFVIHRAHHVWFDECNSRLSIEDNHTLGYSPLKKYSESIIHGSELLNFIPCELDITSTPFCVTTIITYEIELPPSGKKVGFNLLDDEDFTIFYITDTILSSLSSSQPPSQSKINMWIIAINVEDSITAQGALDEINHHQTLRVKYKVGICLCRRKIYHRKYLEEISSRFDKVRPVVSHIEVSLPKKTSHTKEYWQRFKRS